MRALRDYIVAVWYTFWDFFTETPDPMEDEGYDPDAPDLDECEDSYENDA